LFDDKLGFVVSTVVDCDLVVDVVELVLVVLRDEVEVDIEVVVILDVVLVEVF
jgi:hypothetical protein